MDDLDSGSLLLMFRRGSRSAVRWLRTSVHTQGSSQSSWQKRWRPLCSCDVAAGTTVAGAPASTTWSPSERRIPAKAVVICLAAFGWRYISFSEFSNDHFVHLSTAQQMTFGALPVRDFVERGLPLTEGLSALAQIILGPGLHAELLLVSGAFAVSAVLVFLVARQIAQSSGIGAAAAAIPLLAMPVSYGYPRLLPYAAIAVGVWSYASRPTRAKRVVLALLVAAAFLFRHDHGVILGGGVAAALVAHHGIHLRAGAMIARFAGLVFLFIAPYLAFVQVHEGLATYVADGAAFSKRESEKATWAAPAFALDRTQLLFVRYGPGPIVNVRWSSSVPDADVVSLELRHGLIRLQGTDNAHTWQYELRRWDASTIRSLLSDPAVEDTQGVDRASSSVNLSPWQTLSFAVAKFNVPNVEALRPRANIVVVVFYLVWLLPVVSATWTAIEWRRMPDPARVLVVALASVQVVMNLSMLRDPIDLRVRDVLVPASILVAFIAGRLWQSGGEPLRRSVLRTSGVLVLAAVLMAVAVIGGGNTAIDAAVRELREEALIEATSPPS